MSARDELAALIESGYAGDDSDCPYEHAPSIADAILAAGYRKPRTITTAEELDALPAWSIIEVRGASLVRSSSDAACWWPHGGGFAYSSGALIKSCGVATVLHTPEATA